MDRRAILRRAIPPAGRVEKGPETGPANALTPSPSPFLSRMRHAGAGTGRRPFRWASDRERINVLPRWESNHKGRPFQAATTARKGVLRAVLITRA